MMIRNDKQPTKNENYKQTQVLAGKFLGAQNKG